jgi:hypothetical protein
LDLLEWLAYARDTILRMSWPIISKFSRYGE